MGQTISLYELHQVYQERKASIAATVENTKNIDPQKNQQQQKMKNNIEDGNEELFSAGSLSFVDLANLVASEHQVELLNFLLLESGTRFDPDIISSQLDNQIVQNVIDSLQKFVSEIQNDILAKHWDNILSPGQPICYMASMLVKVLIASEKEIENCCVRYVSSLLQCVAEAEAACINAAGAGGGGGSQSIPLSKAKGTNNRNKAKLMIEERLEKNSTSMTMLLRIIGELIRGDSEKAFGKLVRQLLIKQQQTYTSSGESTATATGATEVRQEDFSHFIVTQILQLIDAGKIVDDSTFLHRCPIVSRDQLMMLRCSSSQQNEPLPARSGVVAPRSTASVSSSGLSTNTTKSLSTRISMFASRFLFQTSSVDEKEAGNKRKNPHDIKTDGLPLAELQKYQKSRFQKEENCALINSSSPTEGEGGKNINSPSSYGCPASALVSETPPFYKKLLVDKEMQVAGLIDQVHKFSCMPAMFATITNTAGSEIIEFDVGGGLEGQYKFRMYSAGISSSSSPSSISTDVSASLQRSGTKEELYGRYCRVSPVAIILLIHQQVSHSGVSTAHQSKMIEHCVESQTLVQQVDGWLNVDTGVMYDTFIPNEDV